MKPFGSSSRGPLFPRGPGLGIKALALSLLSLSLIVADQRGTALTSLRSTLTTVLRPLFWVTALPGDLAHAASQFRSRESLIVENRELQSQQMLATARLQKLDALNAENARIRELLSSSTRLEEKVLIAEILAAAQDPYRHQILISKGTRDGVYRGQALVDAYGILGQVIETYPDTSTALLITDPNHGIPVEINRTGLQTIALGRGDGKGLSLPYLPGNADVKAGDTLVSSPLGGRFPAGYPVGEVYEIKPGRDSNFMEAIAYPAARLNQGRQVLLVWSESFPVPEPTPASPAIAEPAP